MTHQTPVRRILLPCLVLLALAGAGCDISADQNGFSMTLATGRASDEWSRTYTLAPGGELIVVNVNGGIEVDASSGAAVEVRAERKARASTDEEAREALKEIEIVEEVAPARVRIETRTPRVRRFSGDVRYKVQVPPGLTLRMSTTNGGVRLTNVDGRIVATTTNGGVVGKALSGSVRAHTTNGGVDVAMLRVDGDVDLETTNGGIDLGLPAATRADVDARCTNGRVRVDDPSFRGDADRRRVRGTINGGGIRVHAETTNGGIRISSGTRLSHYISPGQSTTLTRWQTRTRPPATIG